MVHTMTTKQVQLANAVIAMCAIIILSAVILVYGIDEELSMTQKIAGHLTIIVVPVLLKLAYIFRLIFLNRLRLAH